MNSKELLIKAEQRIAEAENIKMLVESASTLEQLIIEVQRPANDICIGELSEETNISGAIGSELNTRLKIIISESLGCFLLEKNRELEKLLGIHPAQVIPPLAKGTILATGEGKLLPPDTPEVVFPGNRKPATINPEFEAAIQGMAQTMNKPTLVAETTSTKYFKVEKPEPDPVEDKLSVILQDEAKKFGDKPIEDDKSLGKYPPEKRRAKLPDDLLPEIRKMYMDENKQAKEIAEYYKVETKYVSTFIAKHKLRRRTYDKSVVSNRPAETECPRTAKCYSEMPYMWQGTPIQGYAGKS